MALTVYWGSGSPFAWRVLLALEVKKIPYDSKRLSFGSEDFKSPEFLAASPRGKVPAIRDGSYTLSESIAILQYLDDKKPQPALFGQSATERGNIWRAIMESASYLEPKATGFVLPLLFDRLAEQRDSAIAARKDIEQELVGIEASLRDQDYLASEQLSAADISLYPFLKFFARAAAKDGTEAICGTLCDISAHYPALAAWQQRIEAIPGYERTYPPHWRES